MRGAGLTAFLLLAAPAAMAQSPCVNGMAGTYPCQNVDLMARMSVTQLGGQVNVADIWGWTDPQTGKEYALVAMRNGTAFVDLSDPVAPVLTGVLPSHVAGNNTLWRDVDVIGNYAFIVSETAGHGMQVFDLTRLRNVASPPQTFTESAHYAGFSNCHTLFADPHGYVYAVGTNTASGGLHVVNVQNPLAPVLAGTYSQDSYIHENMVVDYHGPDMAHQGRQISFNFHSGNPDKITIVDVTDKTDMTRLSTTTYTGASITHQGWVTADHKYLLMDDEGDELAFGHTTRTRIFNIQDLDAPTFVGFYAGPNASTDHNLYVHKDLVWEANYSSGLRILDAANVSAGQLTQAAYFDEYTANNAANYDGAWGNYPFFASGLVVLSDYDLGLFVLRPRLSLRLKALLEGPYDPAAGLMRDDLRAQGLLPLTEPYTALGYAFTGSAAGASTTSGVLAVTGANAIVDWVVVELRDAADPHVVKESRAALIQRDGDIVGTDGVSPVPFTLPVDDRYIAVRHRNHLAVMTAQPLRVSVAERSYDLSNGSLALYGTAPVKDINGRQALWMGNAVMDDRLKYTGANNDRDPMLVRVGGSVPTATAAGYFIEDANLDGVVKYTGAVNDRDPILVNIGGSVPTAIRVQQLP